MRAIDSVSGRDENIIYVTNRGPFRALDGSPPLHYIDMEYCEANLEDFIYNEGLISGLPAVIKQYLFTLFGFPVDAAIETSNQHFAIETIRQIMSGVLFIHETGQLVHRDIKPRNSNVTRLNLLTY